MSLFSGKIILVGVTGGISAYKVPFFLRELKEKGAIVKVILTENAKKFISPTILSVLSDGVFDSLWEKSIPHIALTEEADLFVILPADYNIIGKVSSGIADDLLSSSIAAYNKKLLVFPSMNNRMFENPIFHQVSREFQFEGGAYQQEMHQNHKQDQRFVFYSEVSLVCYYIEIHESLPPEFQNYIETVQYMCWLNPIKRIKILKVSISITIQFFSFSFSKVFSINFRRIGAISISSKDLEKTETKLILFIF